MKITWTWIIVIHEISLATQVGGRRRRPLRLALIAIGVFWSVAAVGYRFGLSFVILSGAAHGVLFRLLVVHRQRWEKTLAYEGEDGKDGHEVSGSRSPR
jgi:hypothetical protein